MQTTAPKAKAAPANTSCCGSCSVTPPEPKNEDRFWLKRYFPTIFSFILLISGLTFMYLEIEWFRGLAKLLWFVAAYLPVGGKVLWYAVKNISKGQVFNEFFLMGIATLGAFFIGEYAEAVAVMLFYVIGEHFQEGAVKKSRRHIKGLIDNRPNQVKVFRDGNFETENPETVEIGSLIQVAAGEKIALDGTLVNEKASFNTAALTGEAKPKTIRKGEKVMAGMVNLNRVVELQTDSKFEDSTLSKILQLVEQAAGRKAKPQKFITKFAKVYTPIVFFAAVALVVVPYFLLETYVFETWLYRAMVFLVVSCPCALVISIPLGYFGGIGAASKNGILFKGANFLDQLPKIDTFVFDKTGTLTHGVFKVRKVILAKNNEWNKGELIRFAAALESQSSHPIARAITAFSDDQLPKEKPWKALEVQEIPGYGLKGKVNGKTILAGNLKMLEKYGIAFNPDIITLQGSVVAVAIEGKFIGYFSIADVLKEDAAETIEMLHGHGKFVQMFSGDKNSVVKEMAKKLGIDKAYGDLLPQDKVTRAESLKIKGNSFAFVGDGINDAPTLMIADVGIAMGGLGSDAAIETADVVIQDDKPSKLITAIKIGKMTKKVVWQNIILAFGIKALILILAVFGMASLWGAVFADVGVALLAILNAVRLQHHDFK